MASNLSAKHVALLCSLSLLLPSALGTTVVCEELPAELCAFAVSSTSRRCVLETTQRAGRPTEYQCRTSEVVVEERGAAASPGLVETDGCVRACGVDRATVGISSDSLLEPRVVAALCSPPCFQGCPNIVDLYTNLAAGEGVVLSDLCEAHHMNPRRAMTQLQSSSAELGNPSPTAPPPSPM